ncbi:MAG: type II toxin-antitoxin system RelE/ParE family toxin [Nitrospinaceae bacterium]
MIRDTRPISWVKAALKDYQKFPKGAQLGIRRALTVAAEGAKTENAKPLKGLGSGVFEIALKYRTDAYRVVYALQIEFRTF